MTGRDAVDAVAIVVALALFVVLVAEAVGHAAVLLHGPGHVLRGAAGPAWCPSPKPSGTLRRSGGTHTVIGFWHPIGPHGGETVAEILDRKQHEIAACGWTLWSFQWRRMLGAWLGEIHRAGPGPVVAFCGASRSARDPSREHDKR
jgi:hypothetical protein